MELLGKHDSKVDDLKKIVAILREAFVEGNKERFNEILTSFPDVFGKGSDGEEITNPNDALKLIEERGKAFCHSNFDELNEILVSLREDSSEVCCWREGRILWV